MKASNEKQFRKGEHGTDNQGRCYSKGYKWGYINIGEPSVGEDGAVYKVTIIGADFVYDHSKRLGAPADRSHLYYLKAGTKGYGTTTRKTRGYLEKDGTVNFLLGYIQTRNRLDGVLKNTKRISMRPAREMINGSSCYVIEADTRYGNFTVWLDSGHGYHPARMRIFVGQGDDIGDPEKPRIITREDGITRSFTLDVVRFEKVDGVWAPMESNSTSHIVLGSPEKFASGKTHFNRTKIVLNPDHNALGSFADPTENPKLDPELRDGTVLYLGDGTKSTWRYEAGTGSGASK